MSLIDAIRTAGPIPADTATRDTKKAYAERLSKALAEEIAAGMREVGFSQTKPQRGQPGEKEFHGGLGSKKVDVSYSDERHGLIQAVSVKSICFPPFGKNLKNRFGDLCTEAITLHMRFPYASVCMFFAFPVTADEDKTERRTRSTFRRAMKLLSTVGGRNGYMDAGEKFENITLMLFKPLVKAGDTGGFKLFDAMTEKGLTEKEYFIRLRDLHDLRNPHAPIVDDTDEAE
jgi:hypothetical protein